MNLQNYWFQYIRDGSKKYEGRVYDEKRQKIQINDSIIFTNEHNHKIIRVVKNIHLFSSFEEMIDNLGLNLLLPEVSSKEEALSIYNSIPLYESKSKIYGVIAIEF